MDKIEVLLANSPLYAEDLGIDQKEPSGRFKWFLASILFGARISEKIASNTYKRLNSMELTPRRKSSLLAGMNWSGF